MNILNKLTIKHLKMNKKRTLVTIIGILLSTALMVGIGLLISSLYKTMLLEVESEYGTYHVEFKNVNTDTLNTIRKNINIDNSYWYKGVGYAKIENGIISKPYLYIASANQNFLDTLKLVEGRLPKTNEEIVISNSLIKEEKAKFKVGDTVTLQIGNRIVDDTLLNLNIDEGLSYDDNYEIIPEKFQEITTKTYKIVGIIESSVYEEYNAAGYMTFTLDNELNGKYNLFVEYKKPKDTYQLTSDIASNLNISNDDYVINQNYLYFFGASKYDNVNKAFLPLIIIALSVISVGCITVIYNSFAISTSERKKSFGLYSSIGATNKQLKKTVLFEAFIVGLIGILLGILGGFIGIYVVILLLKHLLQGIPTFDLVFYVKPLYIIIPLIFMVLVILISAYLPALRASKVTPIEAIRGNDDIKISKKEVKTPRFIAKLFGMEGVIAYKNIKRNKKKYRITIISLFISIVMFNTFTTYLDYIEEGSSNISYTDFDVRFQLYNKDYSIIEEDIKTIANNYSISKDLIIVNTVPVDIINLSKDDFSKDFRKYQGSDNYNSVDATLIVLIDKEYNKYSKDDVFIMNPKYYNLYSEDGRKTVSMNTFIKDSYDLKLNIQDKEYTFTAKVYNDVVWGLKTYTYLPTPIIVTKESVYNKLQINTEYESRYIFNTKEYQKINKDIKDKKITLNSDYEVVSPAMENQNTRNVILALKILFYGFIALVTLIGVTSVINTIHTSMQLRRKEFAMLRSVGLTPRGFNKLLFFESLFFGLKSLLYGLPVSYAINILIKSSFSRVVDVRGLPIKSFAITIVGVFIIILITMYYASKRIKNDNILESLREENI